MWEVGQVHFTYTYTHMCIHMWMFIYSYMVIYNTKWQWLHNFLYFCGNDVSCHKQTTKNILIWLKTLIQLCNSKFGTHSHTGRAAETCTLAWWKLKECKWLPLPYTNYSALFQQLQEFSVLNTGSREYF